MIADSSDAPPVGGEKLIEARGIWMRLGGRVVLENVDLAVHAGEIVTLIGLNGAGKSTLVRALLGILRPDSGAVRHADGMRIGYSPQNLNRDPTMPMTVRRFLTLGRAVSRQRLEVALEEVGAHSVLDHPLSEISGGELHRVLLARALIREPDLLILDEPLAGVDAAGQGELYELIGTIRDRSGCGVLLVSHDLNLVMAATDTVVCLNRHVCCTGRPQAVVNDPGFAALFGPHVARSFAVYRHAHDHGHDASGNPVPIGAASERKLRSG